MVAAYGLHSPSSSIAGSPRAWKTWHRRACGCLLVCPEARGTYAILCYAVLCYAMLCLEDVRAQLEAAHRRLGDALAHLPQEEGARFGKGRCSGSGQVPHGARQLGLAAEGEPILDEACPRREQRDVNTV